MPTYTYHGDTWYENMSSSLRRVSARSFSLQDTKCIYRLISRARSILCSFFITKKKKSASYSPRVFLRNSKVITYYRSMKCPTRYRTRHFVNNSNTNEDIATKPEQAYVRCVRNEEECVCRAPNCCDTELRSASQPVSCRVRWRVGHAVFTEYLVNI